MTELMPQDDENEHAHHLPPVTPAEKGLIDSKLLEWYRQKDEVILDVVPHSHLDYAWYRDRESSKMREVEAFVKTLEVKNFTLEQMITIKEFIEGGGKRLEDKLREMIGEGRMELISMYSQPDFFLSPEELRFWNYHFGNNMVKQLGAPETPFEYLPDTFGGDENTPKVLAHAGKKAIITMRGDEDNYPLSWWESKDGSRVLKVLMQGGYAVAGDLTHADVYPEDVSPEEYRASQIGAATTRIYGIINRYGERYQAIDMPHMLVMNGNDFTKPDQDLPDVLAGVQERIRDELGIANFKVRTSTLGRYVDLAMRTIDPEKLTTFRGEMRSGKEHYVLRGIDSARMYLKQRLHQVETRIYEAGTLTALFQLADKKKLINYRKTDHLPLVQADGYYRAIEQIIPVGSHDTISGCGSDDAYPLPLSLMTGSYNAANQAARNSIAALAHRNDTYGAYQHKEHGQTFANLLPHDRTVLVELPMQGELEHDRGLQVIVTYPNGEMSTYPAQIIQKVDSRYALCAIPMPGMSSVQVNLGAIDGQVFEAYEPETSMFETDFYSVDVLPNGTLNIVDKRTGTTMKGLVFEDRGDRGDEYTYCPIDGDMVRTTNDSEAKVSVVSDGPVFTDVRIDTQLVIPIGLDGPEGTVREVETRSGEMVTVPISTRMRLFKGEGIDRIEFATTVNNTARDHRLRVLFDAPNAADTVRAKEPYGFTTREAVPIKGGDDWMEKGPVATSHHQDLVTAGDLGLYTRGLPEYEALQDETGTINQVALTLHRSVGYLSRGNLSTRPGWAGPGYATPDAQMIGTHTFEYAVNLQGQASDADVTLMRRDYMHRAEHGFSGADINGLFSVQASHKIDQTALFPTEDGTAVVVRLDNPNGETVKVNLAGVFESAVKCEFDGKPVEGSADMHEFELPPYGMISVRLS